MELPDRYADLNANPAVSNGRNLPVSLPIVPYAFRFDVQNQQWAVDVYPQSNTPKLMQSTAVSTSMQTSAQANAIQVTSTNEDAECLYLILNTGLTDDTVAAELINPDNVGDTDGDGMHEFIDAWGNPIHFLRWAPGFSSDMQVPDPQGHHDPFDPLKIQPAAYSLIPLIWSNGPDGISDMGMPPTGPNGFGIASATLASLYPWTYSFPAVTSLPAFVLSGAQALYNPYYYSSVGGPADTNGDGSTDSYNDNITNQLIGP